MGPLWENDQKQNYVYDANNNVVELLSHNWDETAWILDYKITNIYDPTTAVDEKFVHSGSYKLSQNYPNPFNPNTTIIYQIPELSSVTIKVYDVLGNEVATLVNEEKNIGNYEIEFNSHSGSAWNLTSGVYFYSLQVYPANGGAGSFVETRKMILLK